jgi:hypothetical protein
VEPIDLWRAFQEARWAGVLQWATGFWEAALQHPWMFVVFGVILLRAGWRRVIRLFRSVGAAYFGAHN